MKGYLKEHDATDAVFAGGWLHTGDLGVWHEDGYLELRDRSKDIIISGGENISSIEVEDTLYRHPAVAAAAVVAKPDERWGETPCAFVELRDGASATSEELIASAASTLRASSARVTSASKHFRQPRRARCRSTCCAGASTHGRARPLSAELTYQGVADEGIATILEWVDGYTMVPEVAIRFTIEQAIAAVQRDPGGVMVECGVWRGGCATAMLLAQRAAFGRVVSPVWLLDSFEGLPPVGERDGPLAQSWQRDIDSPRYYDNCSASLEEVQHGLDRFGFAEDEFRLVKGWFEDTVPGVASELDGRDVSLLRLDGDWYESTMTCLTHLEPRVVEDGVILIDDYYAWDGCARATHDYLSQNALSYRIRSLPSFAGAYVEKRPARTDPDRF